MSSKFYFTKIKCKIIAFYLRVKYNFIIRFYCKKYVKDMNKNLQVILKYLLFIYHINAILLLKN